ncbi:hypothetical protein F5051DRAFT_466792 [Lentinula edodes]|nr:hypothetical protein F5051DRAFT_466792 [Lentinula edodes]
MSVHFPSSSESISRRRFTHARRVPSDRSLNRHMACVGEDFSSDAVTFCSSVTSTYTTVTFTPPARKVRHSDAADFFPASARIDRIAEHEEVKAAAGVDKKPKKSFSKTLLKKVRSLVHNRTSRNNAKESLGLDKEVERPSFLASTENSSNPTATASLHRSRRTIRPIPSVATIAAPRFEHSLHNTANTSTPGAREPRARVVRRSRSFNDAECSSLAACIALDEAVRDLMAREMAENQQHRNSNGVDDLASPGLSSEYVTDDEETLQNHEGPEDGAWILENLMDLLKMENDEIAALVAEDD